MASIEEAKEIVKSTPISGIINFYHPITKRGANFEGVCPFHSDTKPSLKINDQKGIYKCFACGAAGDSIKFVQDLRNITFVEAIKDIAEKIGVAVEEDQKKQKNPKIEMGLRVLSSAYKLYKKYAKDVKPENYTNFLKNRNLNEESVNNFGIGYAPKGNEFLSFLNNIQDEKQRSYAIKTAKEIGIVRDGNQGRSDYDFFRDRVVFPIWDHFDNVKGFSSRAVLKNQQPKYLNSGESFIFDKGNILYGFNLAKSHIRANDCALIVEGNMDVIVLHQFGFNYSIGTMGVAFSENSCRILSNMTKNIILGMDSDDAGMMGMKKANELFMKKGILPKYVDYSPSKDPDEFLNEFGRLELVDRIDNARTFVDFLIEQKVLEAKELPTDARLNTLEEIFLILSPLGDGLVAKEKSIDAAAKLELRSSSDDISKAYSDFLINLDKKSFKPQKVFKQPVTNPIVIESSQFEGNNTTPSEPIKISKVDKQILSQIILHPECLDNPQITEILDFIGDNEVKRLISWLQKIYLEIDDSDYVDILKSKISNESNEQLKNIIGQSLFDYSGLKLNNKVIDKMLSDFKTKLTKEAYKSKRSELINKQLNAKDKNESNEILTLIKKLDEDFIKQK
ncbi:MAG: DNA primase [Bacteriovoracaceae bacterium]|jgi:DNA primase|nr:DNA primase [Bacteriovoracaceae bacterium]